MNDAHFHCELPEGHKGLHENGTNAWSGWAYHTAEPESAIQHIKYTHTNPVSEGNNGNNQEK